ncbi:MAG: hypothetical protein JKX76_03165 [Colwellia sp.]|nr:hypothetical protein [Colwellia sp.]
MDNKEISFSWITNIKSKTFQTETTDWLTLAELFQEHRTDPNKHNIHLFNGSRYLSPDEIKEPKNILSNSDGTPETRRLKINLKEVEILVLDYDNNDCTDVDDSSHFSINDAKQEFKDYTHIGYTSHSHLLNKVHKFRIIILLESPIPAWQKTNADGSTLDSSEWYEIQNALRKFAGPCDPASFNANQFFYIPSTHPDRIDTAEAWTNSASALDWTSFDRNPIAPSHQANEDKQKENRGGNASEYKMLDPEQILETSNGTIKTKDIVGKIDGVTCPFHDDNNGTEFARRVQSTGNIFLYCKKCGRNYYMKTKEKKGARGKEKITTPLETLEMLDMEDPEKVYVDASNRTEIIKSLDEFGKNILINNGSKKWRYRSHALYMPEGSGKSRLATTLAINGMKIIFACKSWDQAIEKEKEFRELGNQYGFDVYRFNSLSGACLSRFEVKPVYANSLNPYNTGKLQTEESIKAIKERNPTTPESLIKLFMSIFKKEDFSFIEGSGKYTQLATKTGETKHDANQTHAGLEYNAEDQYIPYPEVHEKTFTNIVITTFTQLRIMKSRKIQVPKDWMIWFDDPDRDDAIDIAPVDLSDKTEQQINKLKNITTVNDKVYYKRPKKHSLGAEFLDHRCVYTTTEAITLRVLKNLLKKRNEELIIHEDMPNLVGGEIIILGSKFARKRKDALIPLFVRRLLKRKYKIQLIADGIGSKYNHSNNKGNNTLSNTHSIIKISVPHPSSTETLCNAIGLEFVKDSKEISHQLALDMMHQAIGRNCGFRAQDKQAIVIADPILHKYLTGNIRYYIDKENSVLIDHTKAMSRKETRLSDTAPPIIQELERLINDPNKYLIDFRKSKPDIRKHINAIETADRKRKYIIRLLIAFTTLSNVEYDSPADPKPSHIDEKYSKLGNWVIDEFASPSNRTQILNEYRSELNLIQNHKRM